MSVDSGFLFWIGVLMLIVTLIFIVPALMFMGPPDLTGWHPLMILGFLPLGALIFYAFVTGKINP